MIGRGEFLAGTGAAVTAFQVPAFTLQSTIGVVAPLSGNDRRDGEALANGVRAAIDDSNRQRTALDHVYLLRVFDDQNSIAGATANASFASSDPTIIAVVGHYGAKQTIATVRTYAEAQMPLIVPAVTDNALTATGYRNAFRLPTRDFDEGQLLTRYALKEFKSKLVGGLVQGDGYGAGVADGVTATLNAQKIPNKFTVFSRSKPDYNAAADDVLTAKPDTIVLAGTAPDMGPVVKVLRDKGFAGKLIASQGFFDPALVSQFAKESEGVVVSSSMPYLALAPSTFRIRNDFEGRYGPFTPVAAFAYAATQIIMSGVRRSGASQRAQLLRNFSLGGNYDTVVGSFTFGPQGDPVDPELYFYTLQNGSFAYLRQAHPSGFLSR
jgi:branched-chain amino acid transport system substrate-binding protein